MNKSTEANQCVVCGAGTPEGGQLCNACKQIITQPNEVGVDDEAELRAAAAKIKNFCLKRIHTLKNGCSTCPVKDICFNEPYLWEV